MDSEYDVIVVGAGFGGPVAAKKCADAGLKTLMLERSEHVGEKVISGLTIPIYGFLFGPAFIRDGNPPVERPVDGIINYIIKDIEASDIEIDDTAVIPRPLAPIFCFGFNAYCKPFCAWEARKAVEAGAELRTSTTVADVIREDGFVRGVVTEGGERIRARIVIDSEGSQGLLAIRAGVREKYPPEAISLADTYDYEMAKEDVDRIFGHSLRFCWGWDEQKIAPPLGHGNGLMVWPYRRSLHFMQDQCLSLDGRNVPNLKKLFETYHHNITSRLPWWKEDVEPHARLRARMWEGFEIYVGLDERLRNMPNHTDGMILIGDAAGLESTELCDGVPAAWFSADIAADVAVEALGMGDTSRRVLRKYDERVRAHPIIRWSISARNRYNLRFAQAAHSEKMLRQYVHDGWGLGSLKFISTPWLETSLDAVRQDPHIIAKWVRMFLRYYYNWHHERFDPGFDSPSPGPEAGSGTGSSGSRARGPGALLLRLSLKGLDAFLRLLGRVIVLAATLLKPAARLANPFWRLFLPLYEPVYLALVKATRPLAEPLSRRMVDAVVRAEPGWFDVD